MTEENKESLALRVFSPTSVGIPCKFTATSLLIPDGTKFESVEVLLSGMHGITDCIRWWIGDTLVFAERNYGEMYAQLVDETSYSYQSLLDMMWVAKGVDPRIRRKELTWSHHKQVVGLPQKQQEEYLQKAVDNKLTATALRELIKGKKPEKPASKAETYETALRFILNVALKSCDKEALKMRPMTMDDVTIIAATASDAIRAFEKPTKAK